MHCRCNQAVVIFETVYTDILLTVISGVCHKDVYCDACAMKQLLGIRWKCAVCNDFDLCHVCYMSNKHDLSHPFVRFDTPLSIG